MIRTADKDGSGVAVETLAEVAAPRLGQPVCVAVDGCCVEAFWIGPQPEALARGASAVWSEQVHACSIE